VADDKRDWRWRTVGETPGHVVLGLVLFCFALEVSAVGWAGAFLRAAGTLLVVAVLLAIRLW
jgi:hypothetical protein